jgi:nitroreductase
MTIEARTVLDVLARQRAHRAFLPDPVPDEDLEAILTAATHAPSAENRQPWEFVVVTDHHGRARLGELMRRAWEGGGREASRDILAPGLLADVDRGLTGGIAAAPVLVVCCADLARTRRETAPSSLFPAVQNLLIAATALGYGSALTTIATVFADELRDQLGLPPSVLPMAVVPVGRPARPLGPGRRSPAAAHTHRERWGRPWR